MEVLLATFPQVSYANRGYAALPKTTTLPAGKDFLKDGPLVRNAGLARPLKKGFPWPRNLCILGVVGALCLACISHRGE